MIHLADYRGIEFAIQKVIQYARSISQVMEELINCTDLEGLDRGWMLSLVDESRTIDSLFLGMTFVNSVVKLWNSLPWHSMKAVIQPIQNISEY